MHAAFALLVGLEERAFRGEGVHVECTMVEGALNAAAEPLVEFTAYGRLMQREGNRSACAAPQGLYPCSGSRPGEEQWLALSVVTDVQWRSLARLLGSPGWAAAPELESLEGRRTAHDAIDARLRPWFLGRDRERTVDELLAAGVPAAPVADPRSLRTNPQLIARRFFEEFTHPVVGTHAAPVVPFRYASVDRWLRSPAPLMGQHNREILCGPGGLPAAEVDALERDGVIGNRPRNL